MISRLCVQFAFQLGLLINCVMVFMTVLNRAPDLLHHPLWKLLHPVLHDQEAIWCQEEFQWSHQWDQEGLREIAELWVTQPLSPCFERICVCATCIKLNKRLLVRLSCRFCVHWSLTPRIPFMNSCVVLLPSYLPL